MVNTILKEADLFCPNSVRINFTIYLLLSIGPIHIRLNSVEQMRIQMD
ncbi:Aspartate aminotransferase [Levilactobacillus zymae]|uniref:Aspartate aminotransferase n=1 Tax=Levilactobacillus zymae TaxID=267363 RepID=A0A1Y6JYS2_9LACO|nr:Aspartate aminotransferase [Levilactobacillus zymae]